MTMAVTARIALSLRIGTIAAGLALLAPGLEGAARADDSTEKQAAAQRLFDDARHLIEGGKFAEACPKLAESQRLDPSIGTQFYLADCLEKQGKIASAWTNFIGAADGAKLAGEAEREAFARKRAEALGPRIPALKITVAEALHNAAGLQVKRDGVEVGAPQWGTAIPLDPGDHLIAADASGKLHWETKVAVQEGATVDVAVPVLQDAPVALPQPAAPPAPAPLEAGDSGRGRVQRIGGFVTAGLGVVGVALGAAFGVGAMNKQSSADPHCDANNRCDPTGLSLRHDGITDATVSTVAFIVGGAALGAGAVLVLTAPSSRARKSGTGVRAELAAGLGNLQIRGSW